MHFNVSCLLALQTSQPIVIFNQDTRAAFVCSRLCGQNRVVCSRDSGPGAPRALHMALHSVPFARATEP
jgi:hypothetical protein